MRSGPLFHVSPRVNRDSILQHGLDPRWMGAAAGIAGSPLPELDGVYVSQDRDGAGFFVEMGRRRFPGGVDLWEIDDTESVLQTGTSGFEYLPLPVRPQRIRLCETFAAQAEQPAGGDAGDWPSLDGVDGVVISDGPAWEPPRPARQPLPQWLAADAVAALRDIASAGADVVPGRALALLPDESDDDIAFAAVLDGAGAELCRFGFPARARGAHALAEFATALQRCWIELPQVTGTLHPPCSGHEHAAVAEERDDGAWWVCPLDGAPVARIGG